jgi:hypothetical protein
LDAASRAWNRLLLQDAPFDPRNVSFYLDALIQARRVLELSQTWQSLVLRFPDRLAPPANAGNRIVNARLAHAPWRGGLDWRITPLDGVRVEIVDVIASAPFAWPEGNHRAFEIEFSGRQNPEFSHIYQFVPVVPGRPYRFRGCLRGDRLTSDRGVRLELLDAYNAAQFSISTPEGTGTFPWRCHEMEFLVPESSELIVVRVARPASRKLGGQIAGRVWAGGFLLQEAPRPEREPRMTRK